MVTSIWKGRRVDSFRELVPGLDDEIDTTLSKVPSTEDVLEACDSVSRRIRSGDTARYLEALERDGYEDPPAILNGIAEAFSREEMLAKLDRELGTRDPHEMVRISMGEQLYESWRPLGVLVHITSGNSPIVAPIAMADGLLSGNINIMKCATGIGEFALEVIGDLCGFSDLGDFVYMLRFPSSDRETMQTILDRADCISVWGGEEAVASIREMAPRNTPFVVWGHKISFAYIEPGLIDDDTMDRLAKSICRNEQQSCSSPQCVLIDTDDRDVIDEAARMLGEALDRAKSLYPRKAPDDAQAAEITAVTQVHDCDLYFNPGDTLRDPENTWRILVGYDTRFLPSPLFRTVWLSPLPRNRLTSSLRSMRQYLQTVGLACTIDDLEEVSSALYAAGVGRITPLDSMSGSYSGEPHDGGYVLPRYLRRVSLRTEVPMDGICSFAELRDPEPMEFHGPIQGKKDYPPVPENGTGVLLKSGGTTGEPVFCSYTRRDYEEYLIGPGAEAVIAHGLDPEKDVVADFLKGGNLYGGLNMCISIFDRIGLPHLRISGLDDTKLAAHYMITGRATVVLGAPSYIIRLFRDNEEEIRRYGRIRKVLYGGELMTAGYRRYLEGMGVESIRSMFYAANETGFMGYPCGHCDGNQYHLPTRIQRLEIVRTDSDEPVGPGEVGRLLFTGFRREDGHTERYDIGDLGRWIEGPCPCGRREPRFELMGRHGDVIRIGGTFFNYHRIAAILSGEFSYTGLMQIILETRGLTEAMVICVDGLGATTEEVSDVMVRDYDSFAKTIPQRLMDLEVREVGHDGFIMNDVSIKLRSIVDRREK